MLAESPKPTAPALAASQASTACTAGCLPVDRSKTFVFAQLHCSDFSLIMGDVEYRCFIGGLSWSTKDDDLRYAFEKFGRLSEAKESHLFLFHLSEAKVNGIIIMMCRICR
ncbi:uncharacterized protein A4U43_C10F16800 [Asparagus officinalis]|uniref:RRM domain-containing protein n=1 Tax=Asparagus officinalis TaxID=4686 RepID=A0A5P1E3L6_ASPOF|nr:uncharacterized protein A4U43_C10F16800 [Asparagus officinalis]